MWIWGMVSSQQVFVQGHLLAGLRMGSFRSEHDITMPQSSAYRTKAKVVQWQKNIEKQRFHHEEAKFQAAEVTATVEAKKKRIQQDKVTNHSAELPVQSLITPGTLLGGLLKYGTPSRHHGLTYTQSWSSMTTGWFGVAPWLRKPPFL